LFIKELLEGAALDSTRLIEQIEFLLRYSVATAALRSHLAVC